MKRVLLLFVGLALLASCEKEIEFNGEQIDPKLVVNSLVTPGQPVSVTIGKSCFFLDEEMDRSMPQGTTVQLYVNDNFIGNMDLVTDSIPVLYYTNYGDSIGYKIEKHFESDYRPNAGDIIKIKAFAPGFDEVEASTSPLPNPAESSLIGYEITSWDAYYYEDYYNEGDSVFYVYYKMNLTIELTDPNPGKTDYYRLHFINGSLYDEYSNYYSCYATYDDPVFGSMSSENGILDISDYITAPENVFTDVLFDGRSYQIKLPVSVSLNKNSMANPDFYRIAIPVEHLSKEYYNYLNTCEQGDMTMQLFAEPVQTYSNVINGYGLVGGVVADTLWFDFPMER